MTGPARREWYLRLIRGASGGPGPALARFGLAAASAPYRLTVAARNLAFDRGWKAIGHATVPVVSVGNLTVGGTGKTPTVEWVARWFRERGVRVTLISRGYGAAEGLNDEGRVLEENLPDCPHLQGPDRVDLARIAVEELEAQVLVLDDAFQHRRLARDLDLVLIDALDPFGGGRLLPRGLLRDSPRGRGRRRTPGGGRLLPRGLLREPIGSLRRAQVVMLSRADLVTDAERAAIRAEAERHAGPLAWVETRQAPREAVGADGERFPLDLLPGRRVAAFCGIGNPEGFRRTLAGLGVEPVGFRAFPDHHPYTAGDVADLAAWGRGLGADLALTTQKDSVKLRTPTLGPIPLFALAIGLEVLSGREVLDAALAPLRPPLT